MVSDKIILKSIYYYFYSIDVHATFVALDESENPETGAINCAPIFLKKYFIRV